ncbi:FKBP-type peptidyl-prolyl cis-trans isomerase [Nocardioides sp. URHA0020]|uniref:FKBP-type peptidyl-prolyl cis-trans isomerase n=1 Tax=Nocardioides sp. URHA0020 TaxID=1380392 RepID=UPI00068631C3|nr:FKBP-type peptidyl-prolyl cis-trans isomerase [Nocardioides sp. URHA0020]
MSRRLRRLPVLLLPLLLGASLVACGSDSDDKSDTGSSDALHGIKITGDIGKAPTVKWDGKLDVSKTQTTVVSKGDGDKVAEGDQVVTNIWIGNGTTKKEAYNTYKLGQPQTIPASADLSPVFKDALLKQTVGSRVAVTATATDAFGDSGNAEMGIGNKDNVLIVVDLMKSTTVLKAPEGAKKPAPAWAPKLVADGDKVTSLDFTGTPKPDGKLRSAALIEGTGDVVKKGQSITVNYLGQVYKAKKPFDESYSKSPATFGIGAGQVIPGWDKTLVGAKVGSRVILAIPPADGYGKAGNAQAGIKGTDTLYFVVDILAAS